MRRWPSVLSASVSDRAIWTAATVGSPPAGSVVIIRMWTPSMCTLSITYSC